MSMPTWEGLPESTAEPLIEPIPEQEPEQEQEQESPPGPREGEGWSVVSLIVHNGIEPPASFTDPLAEGSWAAVSAPWHPAVLARLAALPTIEAVDGPSSPGPREVRIVAFGQVEQLPSGYRTQVEDAGGTFIEAGAGRDAIVEPMLARFATPETDAAGTLDDGSALVKDFQALGTAHWFLRDLTTGMAHADCLDHENFAREALAGARSWVVGDFNTAKNRLRAAFERLSEARERFYPVDAYLIDICLLDPAMPVGVLADALDARTPVTFLATARTVEAQGERDPSNLARLREAIGEGWADVAGGSFDEADEPLLPIESILWQFRHGAKVYREHLENRNVETLARRRFGLYPMLPQIGKRFGFRFAVHLGFDAGRFPIRPEAKRLWESPDHTNLEALTRPPLAADRASQGLRLPWRLAQSMKDDHVATMPLVRWPSPVAGWFADLRRMIAYAPVLARSVTLNDYFHLTDRPFETFGPGPDDYVTPYLAQAVARKDPRPVSRRASHARVRARLDALKAVRAMAEGLGTGPDVSEGEPLLDAETALETGRLDDASALLDKTEPLWAGALARGIGGAEGGGRPGFLVLNPTGVARRAAVVLPDAALDLRPEGPLRAAQFTEEGVVAVVELAPFGYAWIPREANHDTPPGPSGLLTVKDQTLRNDSVAVEIDPTTGGIRGIKAAGEDTARLGQMLAVSGLSSLDGQPAASKMRCDGVEVEYGGPALGQVVSRGAIVGPDGRALAAFRQRVRVWTGRPVVELQVVLSEIDTEWLASIADADPWSSYLACRWAWPDLSAILRRTSLYNPDLTEADRPETPDALDISTRRQRTALLFGGLAHHRRHGPRMLDTILLAGRETSREFELGVVLDLEHPFQGSADLIAPTFVVPTDAGPPKTGPVGWLFRTDHQGVAVTAVEYVAPAEDGRGWGLAFHMIETAGRSARCRLRTFRNPSWARQTDFQNEVIVDLPIDGDAVLVDFTPHELARVEVTLG